jgi:NarL family two-component system response regulator LiaR
MTSSAKTRVLIVDDHAIVREGLRSLIEDEPSLELAGEARNGEEATSLARSARPDVILLDLVMPGLDGIETLRRIRAVNPAVQVVILTSFADDVRVQEAVEAGAIGYLLKDVLKADLVRAIHDARHGRPTLHPEAQRHLMKRVRAPQQTPALAELTPREREVLELLARGRNNRTIADALGISEGTV